MAAPSHDHAKPECPWAAPQGRKWSEDMAQSKPAASAARARASSSEGGNCSCEAWKPMRGRDMRSPGTKDGEPAAPRPVAARTGRCGCVAQKIGRAHV